MSSRVLLVDDNAVIARMIVDLLSMDGFEVTVAGDAEACRRAIMRSSPDVVLMDVQLPGVDGLALAGEVRHLLRDDVAIIAFTSYAMKGDRERIIAAGCDGYIAKPIDTRTFARTVAGFLPRRAG